MSIDRCGLPTPGTGSSAPDLRLLIMVMLGNVAIGNNFPSAALDPPGSSLLPCVLSHASNKSSIIRRFANVKYTE